MFEPTQGFGWERDLLANSLCAFKFFEHVNVLLKFLLCGESELINRCWINKFPRGSNCSYFFKSKIFHCIQMKS